MFVHCVVCLCLLLCVCAMCCVFVRWVVTCMLYDLLCVFAMGCMFGRWIVCCVMYCVFVRCVVCLYEVLTVCAMCNVFV